ncbi:hypothetical protein FB561_3093 [Kribbella amoyensis]|uniref:Small secreted domain DUF320 n=1 Tax=Kribbella amoyensis TaxID=996641 RepID=A0A561BT13_9ACTN|nr:hypothetical protein [Kribbella amoyensis]TWD81969.1 hypothetical protein FB561_3093 [Kribbella amoyensis]
MNLPGKRVLLGTAIATAALGVGGIAYAAGNDPVPEQGYVTIEDGATTPSPNQSIAPQQNGRDCPEKNGSGQQAQPESQPEQGQADPRGQA